MSQVGKDKERKNEGKVLSTTLDIELHHGEMAWSVVCMISFKKIMITSDCYKTSH